ncbi:unnamed protein product [Protopolystoma xenopodis]|uniref:Uncharacterized protein n=1 Tax=Protopolystoma xenopodis TaxID=117903 RepID=A0A3S5BNT2_9PLAT|nr:unnamed protein product [Protopolystoma xenopodis]
MPRLVVQPENWFCQTDCQSTVGTRKLGPVWAKNSVLLYVYLARGTRSKRVKRHKLALQINQFLWDAKTKRQDLEDKTFLQENESDVFL